MDYLPVKLLTSTAKIPARGSFDAVGYDLFADLPDHQQGLMLPVNGRKLIPTSVSMAIPKGMYGRVAPRSGLSVKNGIDVMAGVIDPDYRGEIKVLLINLGSEVYYVNHHDRVAQIIFEVCALPIPYLTGDLEDTARGAGAYGSTGR